MNKIRQIRMALGMSQEDVAKEFGVTRSSVSLWENERSTPDGETLKHLADFFGVSLDYLLGRADDDSLDKLFSVQDRSEGENNKRQYTATEYYFMWETGMIGRARKMAGLTQADVAKQVGMSRQAYANIESKKQKPTLHVLKQLQRIIDFNIWDITFELSERTSRAVSDSAILTRFDLLNEEGQDKVIAYADDLIQTGKYARDRLTTPSDTSESQEADTGTSGEDTDTGKE